MTTETQSEAVRTVAGRELPIAGKWELDPDHTSIEFVARHMMVTKVRGRFDKFSGAIEVGDDPAESTAVVEVELSSVTTGADDRDNHLRSPDFFDIEQFPTMTFIGTGIESHGDRWKLTGDLTLHGVTKPLVLDVEYHGVLTDPFGALKAQFSATGQLEREAYGLTWNVPLESGGVLVSKSIRLEIEAQAVLKS